MKKSLYTAALSALLTLGIPATVSATDLVRADSVIVKKEDRKLFLMAGDEVVRSFDIALGSNPIGHKRSEGDGRTPEGKYILDWRNPGSRFYMSIHVSYPNGSDVRKARAHGMRPGGEIMIHGLSEEAFRTENDVMRADWTDGCIAVRNADMHEIWLAVADGTPIEILP